MAGRRRLMFAKNFEVDYLRTTALGEGIITFFVGYRVKNYGYLKEVSYSLDEGETWNTTTLTTSGSSSVYIDTPTLQIGDSVLWKGVGTRTYAYSGWSLSGDYISGFSSGRSGNCRFNVSGNINTILGGDKPNSVAAVNYMYCLFFGSSVAAAAVVDASELILPTTLSDNCFRGMFYNCTYLTTPPKLPATTLASSCYYEMFRGCTALTSAPSLPALTTITSCYIGMFRECSSLSVAPQLPATFLGNGCYQRMFQDCTSLIKAPDLLVISPQNTGCYYDMFKGCSSLNYIKVLSSFYMGSSTWVNGVAQSGTFIKHPQARWPVGDDGIPTGWTAQDDTSLITEFNPQYTFTPAGYLTFSFSTHSYFGIKTKPNAQTVYVSKNGTTWHDLQRTECFEFNQNEKCYVCGVLPTNTVLSNSSTTFNVNGTFEVSGNCNALWNYSNLSAQIIDYCGYELFRDCVGLTSAENLVLSATTLAHSCYHSMFYGCTSLTKTPIFSATTLAQSCYRWMFMDCTSLTTPPSLPITTLENRCYESMFSGCTSLATVPTLSASVLKDYCYYEMFKDCTSLTTAPTLSSMSLAPYCYQYMFWGCTSLVNVQSELPATTMKNYCYASMFRDCTSLTTAPSLPAETLGTYCYYYMFYGCTSLTTAPELPATTLASYCYYYMFYNCTSLATAPVLPAQTLNSNCYSYMFNKCSTLNYIKALFTTTPGSSYTYYWMSNTASSGVFVKNINATWTTTGNYGVPTTWTIIYYDPDDDKYYTDQQKTTECDDHGNSI